MIPEHIAASATDLLPIQFEYWHLLGSPHKLHDLEIRLKLSNLWLIRLLMFHPEPAERQIENPTFDKPAELMLAVSTWRTAVPRVNFSSSES
jgi:hypothetical protein